MINASFKRDMHNHFLLIEERESIKETEFEFQMLLNNTIKGILKFELRKIDNKNEYCYDITEKSSIEEFYKKEDLSYDQIKKIILDIITSIERGEEYLLNENNFVILPEYIYVNNHGKHLNFGLCYLPNYNVNIKNQMNDLIEYLMNKVNHMDEKAVVLIYGLYKLSREENTTFNSLKIFVQGQDKSAPKEELHESKKAGDIHEIKKEKVFSGVIPTMQEKVQGEKEIEEYPIYIKLAALIIIALGVSIFYIAYSKNLLINSRTKEIDITKVMGLAVVLTAGILYALSKLFDKNNKNSKIVKVVEYIDNPLSEECNHNTSREKGEETVILSEYQEETVILTETDNAHKKILFQSLEKDRYEDILIKEFPFIIGKLKSSVNYVLDDVLISRVHAKITIDNRNSKCDEEKYYIIDLGSTNGTLINGRVLKNAESEIKNDDIISIVNYKYKVKI